jgi:hypothetical protein
VGGVDMAFQRWDDEQHRVADEDGIMYAILLLCKGIHMVIVSPHVVYLCICCSYPGHDYRQPAPGMFKPMRVPAVKDPNNPSPEDDDDEVIEVEVRT